MSRNNQILAGIVLILLIAGGIILWYVMSMPSKDTRNTIKQTAENTYKNISSGILTGPNAEKFLGATVYGQVPVTVNKSEIGKSNPFQ